MTSKIFLRRALRPAAFFSAACLGVLSGCSRHDRDQAAAQAKDAYADTKAAVAHGWDEAKTFSFEQRDRFTAKAKAMTAQMDAQVSEIQAKAADAKASSSRSAAMTELKDADADYKQKVAALGSASAATWDSAKQNAIAAWDRLQAAYYKARAD